jgi:HK97 gp10 family phage protein
MTASQINNNIQKMIEEQIGAVTKHLVEAADTMLQDAETLVPWDTGRTRASLRADINKNNNGVKIIIHASKADDVAFFNEYGTVYMDAKPFFRPAFDKSASKYLDIIVKTAIDITNKFNNLP